MSIHRRGFCRERAKIELVRMVAGGSTRSAACAVIGINPRTVARWAASDRVFADRYACARIEQAHVLADRAIEIADEPVTPGDMAAVQRNRLRVDTIKWLCSKIAPKLYGERIYEETRVARAVVVLSAVASNATANAEQQSPERHDGGSG